MVRCLVLAVLMAIPSGCSDNPSTALPPLDQELSHVPGLSIMRVQEGQWFPWGGHDGHFDARNVGLLPLLDSVLHNRTIRVRLADAGALPMGVYDVKWEGTASGADPWPPLVEAYEKTFGVRIVRDIREMDVFVLSLPEEVGGAVPAGLRPSTPGGKAVSSSKSVLDPRVGMNALSMDQFARILSGVLEDTVVDETGLLGQYDFWLDLGLLRTKTSLVSGVEKLGLNLKRAKRPIEAYYVEKARKGEAAEKPGAKP